MREARHLLLISTMDKLFGGVPQHLSFPCGRRPLTEEAIEMALRLPWSDFSGIVWQQTRPGGSEPLWYPLEVVSRQKFTATLHRLSKSQDLVDASNAEASEAIASCFEIALSRAGARYGLVLMQLLARRKSSFAIHQVLAFLLEVPPALWDCLPNATKATGCRSLRLIAQ